MENSISLEMKEAARIIVRQAAGSSVQVTSVENWGIGALNDCLKVETSHPAACFFIKIEREDIIPTTRRGQIAREVYGIRLAKAAGLPAPQILQHDQTGELVGRRYLVEEFIEGQLFWEIQDQLTPQERQGLREDMISVLEKMKTITSPLFGDLYPGGLVGQHHTWRAACQASTRLLLDDCRTLELYSPRDLEIIEQALENQMAKLVSALPAGLYHGDLGMHNVMVDRSTGVARLGTLIDFGNGQFTPLYMNDQDTRLYGGFDLPPVDVEACYGVSQAEQQANRLITGLDMVVFRGMLKRKYQHDTGPFEEEYLNQCLPAQ